jgi:signal transduction histidine kinase
MGERQTRARWVRSVRHGSKPARRHSFVATTLTTTALATTALAGAVSARADNLGLRSDFETSSLFRPDYHSALGVGLLGLVVFAATTAIIHLRSRNHWQREETRQKAVIADLLLAKDRADLVLASEPQVMITWHGADAEPEILGDTRAVLDMTVARRVLGFGSWLPPDNARKLEAAVERLKQRGEGFSLVMKSTRGSHMVADGMAVAGRAVVRIRDLSADRQQLARLEEAHARLSAECAAIKALLDVIPQPAWLRDDEGKLTWVNAAYAKAVDATDTGAAVEKGIEVLDAKDRKLAADTRARDGRFSGRLGAILAGDKRTFDVMDARVARGSGGIATDVTELEQIRADLNKQIESHVRTLHQLPTAVAIFDRQKRLQFHNEAYRELWQLDAAFLAANPSDGEILDQLRAERHLPEQADFRGWKRTLLEGYQTLDTLEHWWYLPDGRTLRVVSNPNPQGGVTYLFDDVTERFHLESRFNSLSRVQGETLDTLKEGVAVFGSDGRLKLFNPAFQRIWRMEAATLQKEPHIDTVIKACGKPCSLNPVWAEIRGAITGLHDARKPIQRRMERVDDTVIDCATSPLPDGATLVTFADMTASVQAERMLQERNEALEAASQIKNNFVHTVSYELRTPLQNIMGFTEALAAAEKGGPGPLNVQQQEYLGHIMSSSQTLKALVEDILDLASVDTGAVELEYAEVDVRASIEAAIATLRDRIEEMDIAVDVRMSPAGAAFLADGKRIRQILFNLIKNAVSYSRSGQTVMVEAFPEARWMVLRVSDQGDGIPREIIEKVFDRFEAHTVGGSKKGPGLGLAVVRSFVELHGGTVTLDSTPGHGTVVTCRFPLGGFSPDTRMAA